MPDAASQAAVEAAITSRRSIRAFLPKPVPQAEVAHLLDVAARAPSGSNIQPWRVYAQSGAALKRLEGGDPTLSDGIAIANENITAILGYAAIAATVGMLLRGRRRRGLEALVRSLAGMAWTLGTFLVVPVLVTRKIGPIDAIAESARLLKKTWGENLIGSVGIWLGFGIATFLYIAVSAVLVVLAAQAGMAFAMALGALLLLGLLLIGVVKSAIKAIYTAVLYRYAAEGAAPDGFDAQQLSLAFGAR